MKKVFKLEELDCATCADKIETAVAKIEGVEAVKVDFLRESLMLEVPDAQFDEVLKKVKKIIARVEPDACLIG